MNFFRRKFQRKRAAKIIPFFIPTRALRKIFLRKFIPFEGQGIRGGNRESGFVNSGIGIREAGDWVTGRGGDGERRRLRQAWESGIGIRESGSGIR